MNKEFKTKNEIINEINKFINTLKDYKPLKTKPLPNNAFYKYCQSNDLVLLNDKYFAYTINDTLRNKTCDIAIACDVTNKKKILTIRNNGRVKEMDNKLSFDTLIEIYNAFVRDIISHQRIIREIKTIEDACDLLKNQEIVILDNPSGNNLFYIDKISNIKFDKKNIELHYWNESYGFNKNNFKCEYKSNHKYTHMITSIPKILDKLVKISKTFVGNKNALLDRVMQIKKDAYTNMETNFIQLNDIVTSL